MKPLPLFIILTLAFGGCSAYRPTACVADTYQRLSNQLTQNRRLWHSKRAKNYRYQLKVVCFCSMDGAGPFDVRVENGLLKPFRFNPRFEKYIMRDKRDRAEFLTYSTIDKIFNEIQDAIRHRIAHLEVTYHPHWGYPTRVVIDPHVPDADRELRISRFQILK